MVRVLEVTSKLTGRYNVSNVLAALAVCYSRDENLEKYIKRLSGFSGVRGRMEAVNEGQAFPFLLIMHILRMLWIMHYLCYARLLKIDCL